MCSILLSTGSSVKAEGCKYVHIIVDEIRDKKISPFLVLSMIYHESRFETKAKSNAKACGLMQVLPKYNPETCQELKKPTTGIKAGIRQYEKFLKYAKGNHAYALCLYNEGYRCDNKKGNSYSKKVLKTSKDLKYRYKRLLKRIEK